MSEALHNSIPPLDPAQVELLKKMYALLAEAGTLADQLGEGLHERLEELVSTVKEDYPRLTDVVAVVRMPVKQLLEEQLGEEEADNVVSGGDGESSYRVVLVNDHNEDDTPKTLHRRQVALLEECQAITDEVIPAGTVGEFIDTTAYGGQWAIEFRDRPNGHGDLTGVVTSQTCSSSNLLVLYFSYKPGETEDN